MSKESKSTTENKPPAWATPLFKQSASEAQRLYNSGTGGNTYLGNTVAPLSNTTMQGVNRLAGAGMNTDTSATRPLYGAIGQASVSDPFVNKLTDVAGGALGEISGGNKAINTEADYRGILDRAQQPTAAAQFLTDTASGKYLNGEGNPFYRQRLEREIADANARIQSAFSGSGRYGSGANQGVIADNTRDMLMQGLENDYNRERATQLQAVGMLDSANQASLGTQLGAVSGISGVQGQNIDNMLNATGLQANILDRAAGLRGAGLDRGLQATNAMAGLDQKQFENRITGANAVLDAGNILDKQAQNLLSDEIARFYALDNQDWTRLGMLQSAAAGAAGNYGTQVQTQRQPINGLGALATLLSKGG